MSPIPAKVVAFEQRGIRYQLVVEIVPKYRGSFNTLIFGEIKPHTGSLRADGSTWSTIKTLAFTSEIGFHFGLSIECLASLYSIFRAVLLTALAAVALLWLYASLLIGFVVFRQGLSRTGVPLGLFYADFINIRGVTG